MPVGRTKSNSIFINYRRNLAFKDARLLQKALARSFGVNRVFLDVSGVDGGEHWLQKIEQQVDASCAMLVLITKGWADALNDKGERRIDNPNDWVRFEIGRALARGIPVVPVVIDGAEMPSIAELPPNLAPLTFVQALSVNMNSFDEDVERIARRLRYLIAQTARRRRLPIWQTAIAAALALVAGVITGPWLLVKFGLPLSFVDSVSGKDDNDLRVRNDDLRAQVDTLDRLNNEHLRVIGDVSSRWARIRAVISPEDKKRIIFAEMDRLLFIYASILPFVDANTKTVMVPGEADLITSPIVKIEAIPQIAFNQPGHSAEGSANADKLSAIFWDPNLSKSEKIDKIIKDIMIPSDVDLLVSGQFSQNADGSVILRPFVISRSTNKLTTESRTFKSDEFLCRDPANSSRKFLCDTSAKDIRDTVISLLKQSI
jgi:hypothetical protein